MDMNRLKVGELRTMLSGRGLDTKGTKQELIKRLNEAIANESFETETSQGDRTMEEEDEVEVTFLEPNKVKTPEKAIDAAQVNDKANNEEVKNTPVESNEDEVTIAENAHCLDLYDSDLSLKIEKPNMMVAEPLYRGGWGYVWSGVRSSKGFAAGKVWYEVKVLDEMADNLFKEIRVGWSTNDTNLLLGEASNSFAYCSKNGKKRQDNEFLEYGKEFGKGDVIGAFLDFTGSDMVITFTKNGESQGEAFKIPKVQLGGFALFPHVSSRYFKFEVNFGKAIISEKDLEEKFSQYVIQGNGPEKQPWFAPLEGYQFTSNAAQSVANLARIEKREDCEMIMMIGLPGCGKTTWIHQFIAKYPEKRYNVIGLNALMDRMETDGEPIMKKIDEKKWKSLVSSLADCLRSWISLATGRKRNFIFDQTNVFASSHSKDNRGKIAPFKEMRLKAVVIVPSDDDYKSRIEAQKKIAELEKDRYISSERQIMEMKALFTLPPEGNDSPFKEISFVELQREEATKLVQEYNKMAQEKGFGKERTKFRGSWNVKDRRGRGNLIRGRNVWPRQMDGRGLQTMQQANWMQNALMQNAMSRGSPYGGGRLSLGRGSGNGRFDQFQAQLLQNAYPQFGGQLLQPNMGQFFGGNINQMRNAGGYYGRGMNSTRF